MTNTCGPVRDPASSGRWVILTAPTDRGADPRDEVLPALELVAERHPGTTFRVAVLGGSGTSVSEALDEAAAGGASEVLIVSAQTVPDRKMDAWFRRVVGHWLRGRAGAGNAGESLEVRLAGPLASTATYAELLSDALAGPSVPARSTTAPLTSPAWEQVPAFSRHVLVCRGPRCSARGGPETARALDHALEERGLGEADVLVTVTGCLFPCAQAPVMVVYPDDAWYAGANAERVERIVDEHLVGGEPVEQWLGERGGRGHASG